VEELVHARGRGAGVHVTFDPEFPAEQSRGRLDAAPGLHTEVYAPMPAKLHSKAAANEHEAVVSTATYLPESASRFELAAELRGAPADAVRTLLRATHQRDLAGVRAAAARAADHGVFLNDAVAGVDLLSARLEELLSGHPGQVLVAVKRFRDLETAGRLAELARGGAEVTVATRALPPKETALLDAAGVHLIDVPKEPSSLHGNAIVVDGTAYFGTAFLTKRALLHGSPTRQSREIGVVTDDPTAVAAVRTAVEQRLSQVPAG
jgi:hypothetical protein